MVLLPVVAVEAICRSKGLLQQFWVLLLSAMEYKKTVRQDLLMNGFL